MEQNDNVLSIIQSKLNTIVASKGLDIHFEGEISFYDMEWIEKKRNGNKFKDVTPFTLVLENTNYSTDSDPIITNQYALAFLCKESDRREYDAIFDELLGELANFSIKFDNATYFFSPNGKESGVPAFDGSGINDKSFEYILRFNVDVFNVAFGKDVVIMFGGSQLPIRSFKITYGIASYVITYPAISFANNKNKFLNRATFIFEIFVNDYVKANLLSIDNRVNRTGALSIMIGDTSVYFDNARYDGYELAGEFGDVLTVNTYFTAKNEPTTNNLSNIKIDGVNFPVIDYSIASKNITKTVTLSDGNMAREIYLGKARAYVLNVLKDDVQTSVFNKLVASLMSDGDGMGNEFFTLEITFGSTTYSKEVMITDISDDSANRGYWKITLSEGKVV